MDNFKKYSPLLVGPILIFTLGCVLYAFSTDRIDNFVLYKLFIVPGAYFDTITATIVGIVVNIAIQAIMKKIRMFSNREVLLIMVSNAIYFSLVIINTITSIYISGPL